MKFVVVLVAPEHPHNVGFCARAMRANNVEELRIVWPRKKQISAKSWVTAHGAAEILDSAQIFSSLKAALHDTQAAVAFSRRFHDTPVPHASLPNLNDLWQGNWHKIALVLGRESQGLSSAELNLCSWQCEIPMPGKISLNLGQALSVVLYEIAREQKNILDGKSEKAVPAMASYTELESLLNFLQENLPDPEKRPPWNEIALRQWLHRLNPSSKEVRALFGVFRGWLGIKARTTKKHCDSNKSQKNI
ncbi:MAG: RNA methyltransferase [Fibrobacter sp.]|nr:RNA methyltransferase [Fibrobacter sp.]